MEVERVRCLSLLILLPALNKAAGRLSHTLCLATASGVYMQHSLATYQAPLTHLQRNCSRSGRAEESERERGREKQKPDISPESCCSLWKSATRSQSLGQLASLVCQSDTASRHTHTVLWFSLPLGQSVSHSLWHNSRARARIPTGNQNLINSRACVGSLWRVCVQNYRLKYWPAISGLARSARFTD